MDLHTLQFVRHRSGKYLPALLGFVCEDVFLAPPNKRGLDAGDGAEWGELCHAPKVEYIDAVLDLKVGILAAFSFRV